MILQSRDEQILRLCYEQQFLLIEHVEKFYLNPSRREAPRRIAELEGAGFLVREHSPMTGRRALIRLSKLGREVAAEKRALAVPPLRRLNPATLVHDALTTSVRLRLAQLWDAEFVPERAIKAKDFPEIPDGIFFFPSGRGIALEIENSDKGRTRFLRLLERWKETPSITFVLFVAAHEKLFQILSRYLESAPEAQPMGVVLWDALKSGTPQVQTRLGPVDLFSRREF